MAELLRRGRFLVTVKFISPEKQADRPRRKDTSIPLFDCGSIPRPQVNAWSGTVGSHATLANPTLSTQDTNAYASDSVTIGQSVASFWVNQGQSGSVSTAFALKGNGPIEVIQVDF